MGVAAEWKAHQAKSLSFSTRVYFDEACSDFNCNIK